MIILCTFCIVSTFKRLSILLSAWLENSSKYACNSGWFSSICSIQLFTTISFCGTIWIIFITLSHTCGIIIMIMSHITAIATHNDITIAIKQINLLAFVFAFGKIWNSFSSILLHKGARRYANTTPYKNGFKISVIPFKTEIITGILNNTNAHKIPDANIAAPVIPIFKYLFISSSFTCYALPSFRCFA